MSKEQTPIEELVIRLADLYTDLGNAKRPDQGMKLVSTITEEIEQYAQDKVLEALERDMSKEQLEELCYQLYMVGSTDGLRGMIRGRDQVMVIFNERLKTLTKNQNKDEEKDS